ncbi:hypothetical protein CNR22_18205 [Sphingobacteriaceae bacterium]|nr:hypothetical protein CNR22_18205 [Sphingobacteriaceae bacterium]
MVRGFLYFFLFLFLSSCKKENAVDCFKSNGKEITELRQPGSFTKIDMNDKIDVTLVQGPEIKVEVTAGQHIIKNISTRVEDGILKIQNNNKCNFVRGYKRRVRVKITLPYCYSVINNGVAMLTIEAGFAQDSIRVRAESSGDIHLNGTYDYVKAHSNGNGDVYLNGSCKSLNVFINGTNFLRAENFVISDYVFVQTLSKGDCFFSIDKLNKFEYIIYDKGSIYYKGSPATMSGFVEKDASGKLVKED